MLIGSHVSYGPDGLLSSVRAAISYDATTFMFYTGAPQNTKRKEIDETVIKSAHLLMKDKNINIDKVICHAPYIINLANKNKLDGWQFSISFLKEEIKRCEKLGVKYLVLHPGSGVTHTKEEAINNIIDALNEVINDSTNVTILLETMAGKGSEVGSNILEIKTIIDNIIFQNKVGVCIDTCHLNDSGIDIENFDDYLEQFDKLIGINKIGCVHVNDSLNSLGSHKDRHANFGFGQIGFDKLIKVIYHEKLKDVPKILETPYIDEYPPYKFEIKQIRDKVFNENLFEDVKNYYKNL